MNSRHVLVEMKQWFADLTMNVMVKIVVGKRYFAVDADGDGKEGRQFQKVFKDFFYFMGLFLVGDAIHFLQWLDLGGHEKAMKEAFKEMDSLISEFLEEHRRRREPGGGYKGDQDFMDAMLSTLQGRDFADFDAETISKATCLNMIVAGGDTPSVILMWALSLLMNNRHVLKKAQEELELHVGKERQVEVSDINKLFYLQAVIKETLRLYPGSQLSGPRDLIGDEIISSQKLSKQ
ncbi:hypothetical protein RHMOL_Rhmol06G0052300 [Rhododendron molle]|uniref:Uncharacterized protein n=1 Tax=Rhododendron molle TaxID=49168 RepID=A0ACC0NA86_RHOML|nr:hypothetical protein RHMOL_Rhmol06G0052300 [Rhododendron molle]